MQAKQKSLLCVGSPLLDLSLEVDNEFLKKHNYQLNNTYRVSSNDPIYNEIIGSQKFNKIAGGQTLNSLRVAKWISPEHQAQFIGSVGDDLYSKLLIESCLKDNVQPIFEILPGQDTGKCAVLLCNNDRCLVTSLGASGNLTEFYVEKNIEYLKKAELFLGEVYFLYAAPELNKKVFKICSENNAKICIALGAVNAIRDNIKHVKELMPYVDYVFGNKSEYEELGKQYGIENGDIGIIGQQLASLEKKNSQRERICIITQKQSPVVVSQDRIDHFFLNCLEIERIVDTNSAGDAFCGGQKYFIGQLLNESEDNRDFSRCIAAGQYAAQEIIQQIGCTLPTYKCGFRN